MRGKKLLKNKRDCFPLRLHNCCFLMPTAWFLPISSFETPWHHVFWHLASGAIRISSFFFFGAWFFWCVGPFCFWFIRRNLRALGGLFHGVTWRTKPIRTSNLSARRSLTWVIGSRWALIWWINLWASQFGRRTSHSHLSYLVRFRSEDGDGSKPYPPGEHQN